MRRAVGQLGGAMEVTVVFRNMMPIEALVALVKDLIDARGSALGQAGKWQVSIRKNGSDLGATYAIRLSAGSTHQSWAARARAPERAVRTVFERCDRALANARAALDAAASPLFDVASGRAATDRT